MKTIVLCADDYGQNEAVTAAIIDLAQKERISATSCLTTSPHWPSHALLLKPFISKINIGLHFNLTEGKPLNRKLGESFLNLKHVLIKSYLRSLNYPSVYKELLLQINCFKKYLGKYPDYIDGHQHIHQFPIIRQAVIKAVSNKLPKSTYVRIACSKHLLAHFPKNLIIRMLGANQLKILCQQNNILHNSSFSGIYNFSQAENYRNLFQSFLKEVENNGIIMCHPGHQSAFKDDSLYSSRYYEYQYLTSDDFMIDCEANNIKIMKFPIIYSRQIYPDGRFIKL